MQPNVAQSHDSQSSELYPVPHGRGAPAGDGGSPYLVTSVANSTFPGRKKAPKSPPWSAVNRTRYHRLNAFLEYWESHHFSIIRLDLTTAPGGEARMLGPHFEELLRRIERKEKRKVQYWRLTTREGNGVIHSLLAAPGESLYLEHKWLVRQWLRIHGASRVYVKRYKQAGGSRERVSRYLVSQYIAGQEAGVRLSASYHATFGFPLEPTWELFKAGAMAEGRRDALDRWRGLLRGETVSPREGCFLNLGSLRGCRIRLKLKPGWGPDYPSYQQEGVCG